jgi:hypothetical protein
MGNRIRRCCSLTRRCSALTRRCWVGTWVAVRQVLSAALGTAGPRTYFVLKLLPGVDGGVDGGSVNGERFSSHSLGRDLSYFGEYSSDRIRPPLVFLPPGLSFTVTSITALGGGVTVVRCTEVPIHATPLSPAGDEPASVSRPRPAGMILDLSYVDSEGNSVGASPAVGPLIPKTAADGRPFFFI